MPSSPSTTPATLSRSTGDRRRVKVRWDHSNTSIISSPNTTADTPTTVPDSRSIARSPGYGGRLIASVGLPNASVVSEPAPAATRGPNSRSHSGAAPPTARNSERISAAATGVPNRAPTVPPIASPAHTGTGTPLAARAPSAQASATFAAVIGFSGPRLTPPASANTAASKRPGRIRGAIGGSTRPRVAGSGPAWPGTYRTTRPTARPVTVRTPRIQY